MIVGVNQSQLANIEEQHEDFKITPKAFGTVSLEEEILSKMKKYENIQPQSLFSFTHELDEIDRCPRRKVIKNFCFPDDVRLA